MNCRIDRIQVAPHGLKSMAEGERERRQLQVALRTPAGLKTRTANAHANVSSAQQWVFLFDLFSGSCYRERSARESAEARHQAAVSCF